MPPLWRVPLTSSMTSAIEEALRARLESLDLPAPRRAALERFDEFAAGHTEEDMPVSDCLASVVVPGPLVGYIRTQHLGKWWEVHLDDVADDLHIDPKVLMDEDVAESPDLRPRDARVSINDLHGQVVHRFADDL